MFTTKDFPLSDNDIALGRLGYSMVEECAQAVALADFGPGLDALDVATGGARMAFALASSGLRTRSGDIDRAMLDAAAAKLAFMGPAAPEFFTLDACDMALPDGSVSALACAHAVHEMDEPGRLLAECHRVLRPGGTALIMDFSALGFDVIDRVHGEMFGRSHRRGNMQGGEVSSALRALFAEVREEQTALNLVWICRKG